MFDFVKQRFLRTALGCAVRRVIRGASTGQQTVDSPQRWRHTPEFSTMCPDTPPAISRAIELSKSASIAGEYLEFGVYKGFTLWTAWDAGVKQDLQSMRFFGFDSFEGLPKPTGPDAVTDEFLEGEYACHFDEVRENLTTHGVDWNRVTLVKGFFDQSLSAGLRELHKISAAAVVLIDCDLYQSTVPVLEFIEPLLQNGSILLFDDWNCFGAADDRGQRLAMREFLDRNARYRVTPLFSFGWHGQAFSVTIS